MAWISEGFHTAAHTHTPTHTSVIVQTDFIAVSKDWTSWWTVTKHRKKSHFNKTGSIMAVDRN